MYQFSLFPFNIDYYFHNKRIFNFFGSLHEVDNVESTPMLLAVLCLVVDMMVVL